MNGTIDPLISDVLARDACSGCGACTLLDRGIAMRLDAQGYLRPRRVAAPSSAQEGAPETFARICPGMTVTAPAALNGARHPTMGSAVAAWKAWATDPEIRFGGSSGGTLTALAAWLVETGQVHRVTGAGADGADPRRTVPVTITTREEALAAAGSRYAPVGAAGNPACVTSGSAVIAKPCEVSALRALGSGADGLAPLLLSFFCAGTPSAHATDALATDLGLPADVIPDQLRYRGDGWPGEFAVRVGDQRFSTSYDVAWGKNLGRATQWRCKMCVDGVGDSADIVAADYWRTDDHGYPLFEDDQGVSALIARTVRGRDVVLRAIEDGVIEASPLDLDALARVQPLQVERRTFLFARMIGSSLAGRRPPRYRGYGLWLASLTLSRPRMALRAARGTWRRVRQALGAR